MYFLNLTSYPGLNFQLSSNILSTYRRTIEVLPTLWSPTKIVFSLTYFSISFYIQYIKILVVLIIKIKLSESSATSLYSRLLFNLRQLIPRHFIARICHFYQICLRCLFHYPLKSLIHPNIVLGRSLRVCQIESLSKCQNLISRHHSIKITFASHKVDLPLYIKFVDLIDPMR